MLAALVFILMSSFTEKIYNSFSSTVAPQIQNQIGFTEKRWTLGSQANDTLLNLALRENDDQSFESSQNKDDATSSCDPSKFFAIFDDYVNIAKKSIKTSSSSHKNDQNALKNIGFQTSKQNLQTLLSLERQSIQRGVISSYLDDGDTKKRLTLFLMHLAETNFANNQVIQASKAPLNSHFKDEVLPIDSLLKRVRNDLLSLS